MNGAVGGVAAIIVAVVVIFYLRRRRSRAPSTAASGLGASQPAMDEIKQTSTEGEKNTGSSLPGTSPMSPKFYVRVFICNSPPLLLCSSHVVSFAFLFCFDTQGPNDSTTFPEDQGALQSPAIRQGPVPSHNASTQGSRE